MTQDELEMLIFFIYSNDTETHSSTEEQEWGRYAIEMLILELLVREKNEVFNIMSACSQHEEEKRKTTQKGSKKKETENDGKKEDKRVEGMEEKHIKEKHSISQPPPPPPPPPPSPPPQLSFHRKNVSPKKSMEEVKRSDVKQLFKSPYSSAIISNAVDCSLACKPVLTAELQLQVMAFKTYKNLLDGIQNARPIPYGMGMGPVHEAVIKDQSDECSLVSSDSSSFPMVFQAFNKVYFFSNHHIHIPMLLRFWNETSHIVSKRCNRKQLGALFGSTSLTSFFLSTETESVFLQELINLDPTAPQMDRWYLYFSLFYLHMKCSKKIGDRCLFVNRQEMFNFLVKCCELEGLAGSEHQKDFAIDVVIGKVLSCLAQLYIIPSSQLDGPLGDREMSKKERHAHKERGVDLLLEVLVHILRKRLMHNNHTRTVSIF